MMAAIRKRLIAALPLVLAACATSPPATVCAPGLGEPMLAYELFFGRTVPNRADVSDPEWTAFIEDSVTPALPDGFTVFDARGAWYSTRAGRTIHQTSKVILVALPDTPASLDAVNRVRSAYKSRFNQQLVGMTAQPTCGTFR